ncbi:hypothetical protein ACTXG6_23375 [Pseudonocardia sp. Cha107L01]|uniref:hypothetical protein n=1 Tax=Pseudonocardia sp. Cha107L01 TaxID=3457576 RepID=UPI00403EDC5D
MTGVVGGHAVISLVDEVECSLRGVWDEEAVDELDHGLQAAGRAAARVPGDDELLVAALLPDVAHSPLLAVAAAAHDEIARSWLTPRFGPRVGWLAGAHVVAKRHLAAIDPGYAADLSAAVRRVAEQRTRGQYGEPRGAGS